jgi:transmembrane sensor
METDPTYPVNLITSYLAGEASEDDQLFLEAWLKADPENRKLFDAYRKVWLELEKTRIDDSVSVDDEWNNIQSKIFAKEESVERRITPFSSRQIFRIAALIIIILVPSFFIFRSLTHPVQKQLDATLNITEGKLPDGTSVTLNKGAVIEYPSVFKGDKRNVKFTGEAYFEVKHIDSRPFIITSNKVRVEVLGTSFYVNTHSAGKMEVILNSGSVAVYFEDHLENRILLKPGEKVEIDEGGEKLDKDLNTNQNYNAWMTRHFIYSNTPLGEIVIDLNKVYQANLHITSPISSCLVTATFDHQNLASILNVLKATLDLKIVQGKTGIEISGNRCN